MEGERRGESLRDKVVEQMPAFSGGSAGIFLFANGPAGKILSRFNLHVLLS